MDATPQVRYNRNFNPIVVSREIRVVSLSEKLIRDMTQAVVDEVGPRRIYLFGSCARGTPTADSDLDLLIVEDEQFDHRRNRWTELKRIRRALRPFRIPKDILLYSNNEFEKWRDSVNHIVAHAVRDGRLLYERP